jgi:hypothetical protein
MATTPKGIYYPTASDQVAPLHTVFAGLASSVDAALPLSGSELVVFSGTTAGATQSVTVTFPLTLPLAPTRIQGTVRGPVSSSSSYVVTVTNSTTTSFTATIYRLNAGSAQNINLVWSVMN